MYLGRLFNSKQGPPDLEELLKKWINYLSKGAKSFSKNNRNNSENSNGNNNGSNKNNDLNFSAFFGLILLGLLAIFGYMGFFIVQPGEEAAVLRFGKYVETVSPGPHWIMPFVSQAETVNVHKILRKRVNGEMITKEVNIVNVSLAVQYRINNLKHYLFEVKNPENSLNQATESAMRQVIADLTLEQVLSTTGHSINLSLGKTIQGILINTLKQYKTGIEVLGVEILSVVPPEKVKEAFNDAIKAQEDEISYQNQAEAYAKKEIPSAEGEALRINAEARAYAEKVVLDAKGDIAKFNALLTEYNKNPNVMRTNMYISNMEKVFKETNKFMLDNKLTNNLIYLPIDKLRQEG